MGDRYPMIPAQKGSIEEFLERLPDAVTRAANVMMRIETVLSDENLASLSATLANIESAAGELPEVARQTQAMTAEISETAAEVRELAVRLRAAADASQPEIQGSLASVRAAADRLSKTAESLEQIISGNEAQLSQFAGSGLAELHQLVIDARDATGEIRSLARSLRENPAQLIRSPPRGGVELPE
jgi:phospholipid/cholesterol/gamma-HCH transport system substrate-binding protein